ncbi:hypothetical protein BDY17DRAFT_40629 [Neohortaea acidophila]|uniref:RGS domain-containing protein n=1 Tax=Neohortaea acidophila TaxID=245834 RepID=A0A6A6PJT5_9PEZI|nr:uncharacterized protein BDY17DRAFT_40629 [Neohortaea acidophila]KAF2479527.1 hypothetical protein BDY17DRAFT_40629 [Neohortaea acidophila]
MVYKLSYRRPSYNASNRNSLTGEEKERSINESIASMGSSMSNGIPEALSFDRVVAGGACPPCTLRDFMNYLKYIEHSAENLQFYLWFHDYSARFENLPASERALSPPWSKTQAEAEVSGMKASTRTPKIVDPHVDAVLQGTEFADTKPKSPDEQADPFGTPDAPSSPSGIQEDGTESASSAGDEKTLSSSTAVQSIAANAFEDSGFQWKPFTAQPYRDEINRIITIYLMRRSSRELNISDRERVAVLHALQNTTHPTAFRLLAANVEYALRRQSHPNFIRWTICNGNRPRVVFARGLGVFCIVGGLLADLLITLSRASRGWRALPFLLWFLGIATLIAAWKGMCVVLHGLHHRHLRPWELFADDEDDVPSEKRDSSDSLASSSRNSFEDEPWVASYRKRNLIRKIFDRELWIEEPALRQIQDTIFLQAIIGSFALSAIIVGIFCAVPKGNFY